MVVGVFHAFMRGIYVLVTHLFVLEGFLSAIFIITVFYRL